MPSGRKPNLERRRHVLKLRDRGLTLHEIALCFGVSKQAIWSLLHSRAQRHAARAVACCRCGATIRSPAALQRDEATALCLNCLQVRPEVSFAQRLQALRLAAGLSRAELAGRSGVAPGSLRAYEDGQRSPRYRSVLRLAAVLGNDLLDAMPELEAKAQFCDA